MTPSILLTTGQTPAARSSLLCFGSTFTEALLKQAQGRWTGPIESAYWTAFGSGGLGFRRGVIPELDEIRAEVSRDWRQAQLRRHQDDAYQRLLDRYTVRRPELTTVIRRFLPLLALLRSALALCGVGP